MNEQLLHKGAPSEAIKADAETTSAPDPEQASRIGQLPWLVLILGLALALRCLGMNAPLQQDEFGPLYAVAQRPAQPGMTPIAADPLRPVPTLHDVRQRSVLPYGIVNPHPLYHYLVWLVVQVLPITEWSLRLPSLLMGVGCVAALYWLCMRWLGPGCALAAALLAAVDPMQIRVSYLARPYALGNLACVLSFVGLLAILDGRRWISKAAGAILYGAALALLGYLNPLLLAVLAAHGLLVAGWLFRPFLAALSAKQKRTSDSINLESASRGGLPADSIQRLLWWLSGCGLAVLLLLPQQDYFQQVSEFGKLNRDYLYHFTPPSLFVIILHNSSFLIILVGIGLVGRIGKRRQGRRRETRNCYGWDGRGSAPRSCCYWGWTCCQAKQSCSAAI